MKLTQKLLGYLNRVFDKGPGDVLALRLRYDGAMTWRVEDGVLSTAVIGGTGAALRVPLSSFTVSGLAAFLAAQPGYSVPFLDAGPTASLSALALMDAAGDQDTSNGDHLRVFTSVLWAYLEGQATELTTARAAIAEALVQMTATTASGEWVDEHGTYYGVPRKSGELDFAYSARMVAEVGRARGNNVAISEAVKTATAGLAAVVVDVPTVVVSASGVSSYGLFDLVVDLDIETQLSALEIDRNARSVLEAMRDAGTHLRTLRFIWNVRARVVTASFLQHGLTVTVLADGEGVSWLNDAGAAVDWINEAGQVVPWTPGFVL